MKPKPIPIKAAQDISERYGYDQIVILGRKTGGGGLEHLTTYGIDKTHCKIASDVGEFLRTKVMGWESGNTINHE